MLFNSFVFIFAFLPFVFFGFYFLGKFSNELASLWLAAASLFFYGWWDERYIGLLLGSIMFNYGAGYLIGHNKTTARGKKQLLAAIATNIILLGYYKYANFFILNINLITGADLPIKTVFLPLGISFFTFTQIAFLVDTFQGKVKEYNLVHYMLFVTYFPHLIAGPVLHHKEMMPQFVKHSNCKINWNNLSAGLAVFVLGLFKKTAIADTFSEYAAPIFDAINLGSTPMFFEAWLGALAYTLQLYFDFSAYSDMAIGLSLMFNVRLPMNFNSPYKATNIIEFWRRWHMTLSRFLRDYLYIPLGGSRVGKFRRHLNLMITMLLGGLWHGAGWTFIIWGGLHGFYLVINHLWRHLKDSLGWSDWGRLGKFFSILLTFLAVIIGWVFFRAENFASALAMLNGMLGLNGISINPSYAKYQTLIAHNFHIKLSLDGFATMTKLDVKFGFVEILFGMLIVFLTPNTSEILRRYKPTLEYMPQAESINSKHISVESSLILPWIEWRPSQLQGIIYGVIFFLALSYMSSASTSEFLYFQF